MPVTMNVPPVPPIHPFRFGVQATTAADGRSWLDLARRCEANGYAALNMPDHFDDQLAPMPALTAAAAVTTSLRVGALVFDNDYKHPAVLAKELATMDVISGGRVDIGIGAGWLLTDYERLGLPYDRAGVRIERMLEGLSIIRSCMAGETFSFSGEHYTITDYPPSPRAVQAPCPPVLIGGGGKRVLTIAAQQADIVGVNPSLHAGAIGPEAIATMSAAAVDAKLDIVRSAAGARLADIELHLRVFLVNVTDEAASAITGIAALMGVDEQTVRDSPYAMIGSATTIADKLRQVRERWGFSYVTVGGADIETFAPVVAELAGS